MLIEIYADGSSSSKGDLPGGWAFVIVKDGSVAYAKYGGDPKTTNNLMELTGLLKGMEVAELIKEQYPDAIFELVSDSQYALGIASGTYHPMKNLDLCQKVITLAKHLNVTTRWVRGHSGNEFNERCDSLAKLGKSEILNPKETK